MDVLREQNAVVAHSTRHALALLPGYQFCLMPLTPTEKVRNARRRKRNGRAVLKVEVDVAEVSDFLVDGGFLQAWDSEDRGKIEQALTVALQIWSRS